MPIDSSPIQGLYGITPEIPDTARLLSKLEPAFEGGLRLLQYRAKTLEPPARLAQAQAIAELCRKWAVTLIINDDPTLAQHTQAHGVHLGLSDLELSSPQPSGQHTEETREQTRANHSASNVFQGRWLTGISCYASLQRALQAQALGAHYVAFGSMYPSRTKPGALTAPLSLLHQARHQLTIPIVAIGGITLENAPTLLQAGAHALAVISGLFDATDIRTRTREFQTLFPQRTP